MGQRTAVVLICTGKDYWQHLQPMIDSVKKFFPADILLFTDIPQAVDVTKQVRVRHQGWPNATLKRYHTILTESEWLSQYSHVFYLDVDLRILAPIGDEIFSDGVTAILHTSFVGQPGTPEENPRSTACLSRSQIRKYYFGGFIGGSTPAFLKLAEAISKNVDIDTANGFIATWHDESHLNWYLYDNPPTTELSHDYNSWQIEPSTKILRVPKGTPNRPAVNGHQPFDPRNAESKIVLQSAWVGSTMPEMFRVSIKSYLRQGHEFHLYTYGPVSGVPEGVVIKDANEILPLTECDYHNFKKMANFTDFFRIKMLYEIGGWYVDIDSICLKPLDFENEYVFASERMRTGKSIPACSFMKAPAKSPMFEWMWAQCKSMDIHNLDWSQSGMNNLRQAIEKFSMQRYIVAPEVFCPVNFWDAATLVSKDLTFDSQTVVVHLFNEMWTQLKLRESVYKPESFYGRELRQRDGKRNVLIAIVTCKKYADRVQSQRDVWYGRAIRAGFDIEIFDGDRLGCSDEYGEGLTHKTRGICQWAFDHGYDYLLKCDDDTWVNPEKLKVPDADYAGILWPANDNGYNGMPAAPPGTWPHTYALGGAYWVSRKLMELVAKTPVPAGVWSEDRWVGHLVGEAGLTTQNIFYGFYPRGHDTIVMQVPNPKAMRIPRLFETPKSIYQSDGLTIDWLDWQRKMGRRK